MKRIIALTLILTTALSYPCYAKPQYSEATKKLMQEAGQVIDYDVDEVMRRQEARRQAQANKSTLTTQNGQNGANRTLKTANDEYRIVAGGGNQSVKVTDTEDELHIYSNDYSNPTNYSKYSNDEFRIYGQDTPSNDGYSKDNFDELHIDPIYQGRLWRPEGEVRRLGIDEIRLPNDPF